MRIFSYIMLFIGVAVMVVFVYGLIKISLQTGDSSSRITTTLSYGIGSFVMGEEPTSEQMTVINRGLRFSAHFILFFLFAYMLGILLFLICRRFITRLFAIIIDWVVSFALAYFTEYFKQFVDGRHFQLEDVRVNMIGALLGLCFFLVSLALFEAIHSRKKE